MTDKLFFDNTISEIELVKNILGEAKMHISGDHSAQKLATEFTNKIRSSSKFSIEDFLNRYSISSEEGVAIISDKLSDKDWGKFLFKKTSSLQTIFASFGLYFSGKFTDATRKDSAIARFLDKSGQALFIKTLRGAILYLSKEFVFSSNMEKALKKCSKFSKNKFAFDLLGESSRTQEQAEIYYKEYLLAIDLIKESFVQNDQGLFSRPNLSVKLTSLHPRFELAKMADLKKHLIPKLVTLINKTSEANVTITFDAEEYSRSNIYLLFLSDLLKNPDLKTTRNIGFVVQAYQRKALQTVKYIISLAKDLGHMLQIRLVKGAYWDAEIKRAQELGLEQYPVFTKKNYTDLNYLACAKYLFANDQYVYPQFATHNALTAAQIIKIASEKPFEFQKLYGMGNALHEELIKYKNVRIYAPVGSTKDLLAYLMRRILENGASANFVSKVRAPDLNMKDIVYNLNDKVLKLISNEDSINLPEDIYKNRKNAMGYDLDIKNNYDYLQEKVNSYADKVHVVGSIINGKEIITEKNEQDMFCPAKKAEKISAVTNATESEIKAAIKCAAEGFEEWSALKVSERAKILNKIADLFEENKFEIYGLLVKEAGKSISDAVNEVIEAIDFCRYYASEAKKIMKEKTLPGPTGESNVLSMHARGVFLCISPWNFPFAIFTGQIVAALVTGNAVVTKPAVQTTATASYTIKLMHKAGIPTNILHLLCASGSSIGKHAVTDDAISGVVFTGSCHTAQVINSTLAMRKSVIVPFIAETGGQNAMIVDSSALLEQVTDDVLTSAFYSAGQRCSALRVLYIQEDIYDELLEMIKGAMSLLKIGDTADFSNDIGPVIDSQSKEMLEEHIKDMQEKGFAIYKHPQDSSNKDGHYFYPHIIEVNSINDIEDEKFGPILHVTKYKSSELDNVIDEVNDCGFGLTFGIHSRIEEKIEYIRSKMKIGNIYANRSITGAKVESQPFGGENKSGTGFKAGGPHYLLRFLTERTTTINTTAFGGDVELLNIAE